MSVTESPAVTTDDRDRDGEPDQVVALDVVDDEPEVAEVDAVADADADTGPAADSATDSATDSAADVAIDGDSENVVATPRRTMWRTPNGIVLQFHDGRLHGSIMLDDRHQGAPGAASSGVLANLLDEILGTALAPLDVRTATTRMEVDYLGPVPLGTALAITTWITHDAGSLIFAVAELRSATGVVAQGTGTFRVGARLR